ncbi:hypothetical protein L1049_001144 [Liquidambar formosana]|uniref:FAS1 domain-containing protein n=1 Tax=Liquidambar formosana TaxID=63359 RepID=A0AAP0NA38_LIQFO
MEAAYLMIMAIILTTLSISTAIEEVSADSPPQLISSFTTLQYLAPILSDLGFQKLADAVPFLPSTTLLRPSTGPPYTIFAPSDASIRACPSCSVPRLLEQHIVPGIFSLHYLRTLHSFTKIDTIFPRHCLILTYAGLNNTTLFINGVEITHLDLFNDGIFLVHRLDGFVSHLSPSSGNDVRTPPIFPAALLSDRLLPELSDKHRMLEGAILRLQFSGFIVLSIALRLKHAELVNLHCMTVFAPDDVSTFSGARPRFHIVPNRFLTADDLERLPVGTVLKTLENGQTLTVTTAGGGATPMRINYVRIKSPDAVRNLKIVVHGLFFPLPRVHPSAVEDFEGMGRLGWDGVGSEILGNCGIEEVASAPEIEWTGEMKSGIEGLVVPALTGEIEDHDDL